MLSGLGSGGFPGRGTRLKGGPADWPVFSGHAPCLLMDSSLPAWSDSAARGGNFQQASGGIAAGAPATVPGGVVTAVTATKEAAHCIPPHRKAKHRPKSES